MQNTINRTQIAERLGCSVRTLIRIEAKAGVMPIHVASHGELIFLPSVVEKLRPFVRRKQGVRAQSILTVAQARRKAGAR